MTIEHFTTWIPIAAILIGLFLIVFIRRCNRKRNEKFYSRHDETDVGGKIKSSPLASAASALEPLRNTTTEALKRRFESFSRTIDGMTANAQSGPQQPLSEFTRAVLSCARIELLNYNSMIKNRERLDEYIPGYHLLVMNKLFGAIKKRYGTISLHVSIEPILGFCVDQFGLKALWSGFMRNHARVPFSTKANAMGEYLIEFFTSEELMKSAEFSGLLDHWMPEYEDGVKQISRADFYRLFKQRVLDEKYFPEMRSLISTYDSRGDARAREVANNQRQRASRVRRQSNRRRRSN